MRIVYMTSSSSLSGGTRQAMYSARGLMERGHEVVFLVPHDAEITDLDSDVTWKKMPENHRAWRAQAESVLPPAGEPCVIHAFHNRANKHLAWWSLSWRKRGCVCLGYRGVIYRPSNPLPYWSPGMDCFTANSKACARILRRTGLPARKLEVVYNGIPLARVTPGVSPQAMRAELGLQADELVFGTVAGDKPVKGVDHLLRAFAKALGQGLKARLLLLGARGERWKEVVYELGIAKETIFRGRVENVADHLQVMDAFFLPSLKESLPNVVLEAFFFGLPVVGSNVGGMPELVTDNGILVPPADADALAKAMLDTAADDERRAAWGRVSLAKSRNFTVEAKLRRTVEVYDGILQRRGIKANV